MRFEQQQSGTGRYLVSHSVLAHAGGPRTPTVHAHSKRPVSVTFSCENLTRLHHAAVRLAFLDRVMMFEGTTLARTPRYRLQFPDTTNVSPV